MSEAITNPVPSKPVRFNCFLCESEVVCNPWPWRWMEEGKPVVFQALCDSCMKAKMAPMLDNCPTDEAKKIFIKAFLIKIREDFFNSDEQELVAHDRRIELRTPKSIFQ